MLWVFLQFRVLASDNRLLNEKTGTADIIVNIDQDESPYFVNSPFTKTVVESHAVNSNVVQTFARDNDLVVSLFFSEIIQGKM